MMLFEAPQISPDAAAAKFGAIARDCAVEKGRRRGVEDATAVSRGVV